MTPTQPDYLILSVLWLLGIPAGLAVRYAWWGMKQDPDIVTVRFWWHRRKSANVLSIVFGIITTWFWAEGSLYQVAHLEKLGVGLTYGFTPIASTIVAVFAHYILAAGKRKAEAVAGGPIPEED